MITRVERFWSKVDRHGPISPGLGRCWVWIASRDSNGYGQFRFGPGRAKKAHRVAFFLAEGRWPEPLALHRCDNPPCVRRSHLFEGTQRMNMRDAFAKGRVRGAFKAGPRPDKRKLDARAVALVKDAANLGTKQADIARALGVSQSTVSLAIRRGR